MAVALKKSLEPDDLSSQEGCFYVGSRPDGKRVTLWEYDGATKGKDGATRFWFVDVRQHIPVRWGERELGGTAFSYGEMQKYLRRLG